MKTQVLIINKLAKDPGFQEANRQHLRPLWAHLAGHFQEHRNLAALRQEQVGILVWSLGHADLDVVKGNFRLWSSLEMFILTEVKLKSFNNFNLSQITYGFSKAQQGSKEFWDKLGELYEARVSDIDVLGVAIVINSFGRSLVADLRPVLAAFRPVIMKNIRHFNNKEILLIISGIASDSTAKLKP